MAQSGKKKLVALAAAAMLGITLPAFGASANESVSARPQLAHMTGSPMGMHGMMMHPGMMGMMMNPGMTGMMNPGMMGMMGRGHGMNPMARSGEDHSADDVRGWLETMLKWHGNARLKVGEVTESDDDTVIADIVTQDGSLVQRYKVDRHSGWMQPAE